MFDKLFDVLKQNLHNPKFYAFLLVIIALFILLFPYIDANFLYYNRVNNRISIIEKMSTLDMEKVKENQILQHEYDNILAEIEKQSAGSLDRIFIQETNSKVNTVKFITGGAVFWLFSICCFFINTFDDISERLIAFFLVGIIGTFLGFVARALPTIVSPIINYICFPLLTILIACLLVTDSSKKSTDKQ